MHPDEDWAGWFAQTRGRPPRAEFLTAVAEVGDDLPKIAVDLGAGDGTETRWLLERGWRVHALDGTPGLRARILDHLESDPGDQLTAVDEEFGAVTALPQASLIYAGISLPFGTGAEIEHILGLVAAALEPGGVFAAHFLGERDSWASRDGVTVQSAEELDHLLRDFAVQSVAERELDGPSGTGPKHWHIRFVVAGAR
jgi:trans-aconitate methyltransferase